MVKLLVSGDVCGQFKSLFSRAGKIQKSKNGPFDALLCVGNFFGTDATALTPYLTGKKAVPLPTFFVTGGEAPCEATTLLDAIPDGGELAPNLTYLGRSGVCEVAGLRVAFLSGRFEAASFRQDANVAKYNPIYTHKEIRALFEAYKIESARGIDVLLTSEWARGVSAGLPLDKQPDTPAPHTLGSPAVRDVVSQIGARYHFCGTEGVFYSRVAFKTESSFNRTFALGKQGGKPKSLYAINLAPVAGLDVDELTNYPAGCTESPYQIRAPPAAGDEPLQKRHKPAHDFAAIARAEASGNRDANGFNRWGLSERTVGSQRVPGPGYVCKICNQGGHFVQDCSQAKPRGQGRPMNVDKECWFCLGSDKVETQLVIGLGSNCYVAMDKGPLSSHHVLLLPHEHEPSFACLSAEGQAEINKFKEALRQMYSKLEQVPIFWERNIPIRGQNHMQLQAVGVSPAVAAGARAFVLDKAEELNIDMEVMEKGTTIASSAGKDPYLYIELAPDKRLLHRVNPDRRVPGLFNFARASVAALLGQPHKADWKQCKLEPQEELELVGKIKEDFAPFDFTQGSDGDSSDDSDSDSESYDG